MWLLFGELILRDSSILNPQRDALFFMVGLAVAAKVDEKYKTY